MHEIVKIGLLGAGLIGKEHAKYCQTAQGVELVALADPTAAGQNLAQEYGVEYFEDYEELLKSDSVDAVIVALPNTMHADAAVAALERGLPVLVEKPLADTAEAAQRIVRAEVEHQGRVLVGHQRRHAPDVVAAKQFIQNGGLGEVVSVGIHGTWRKNDEYFDVEWRKQPGGGPILINLIHDIDAIRYLVGDIEEVVALGSSQLREFPVVDTAGAVLRFVNGAIGTALISDAAASPWSWDLTSGYGAYFPSPPQGDTYYISGTKASIALPSLTVYQHQGENHWQNPMVTFVLDRVQANPYIQQLEHFSAVARRLEEPIISARDAYRSLAVTMAIDASQAHSHYTKVVDS